MRLLQLFGALLSAQVSAAQLYVGPASTLYVPAGGTLHVDSLTLQPAAVLSLSGNHIQRSNTPEWAPGAGNATILQVYEIDTPLIFAGTLSITYADNGLNGNSAASLGLLRATELQDTLRFAAGALNNLSSRTITMAFTTQARLAKLSAASTATPLPLDVLDFEARKDGPQRARLDWQVSGPAPGDAFIIQRSADGKAFNDLLKVPVRAAAAAYLEFDEAPLAGLNVYRLASLDLAGNMQYHGVRSLVFGSAPLSISAWPVPAGDVLHISFGQKPPAGCRLLLIDAAGKLVMSLTADAQQIEIPIHRLSAGSYMLRSTVPGTEALRILKQ